MDFGLNTSVDPASSRERYSADGFVHVPNVLTPGSADRICKCLMEETTWNMVFNDHDRHIDMPLDQVQALDGKQADRLQRAIFARARQGFQYCYHNYPIHDAYVAGLDRGHLLHRFYEFLNGEAFLDLARAVTGLDDIAFADAQATRYLAGHFLTTHDDTREGKNRRAAYVFNFTRSWSADWGGYLQLLDEAGHIRRGLKPTFNALNIIAIPQTHNVGFVAPFAGGMRLSITGWLRAGAQL